MRQVLFSGGNAIVARMPRPAVADGTVLVRVLYSLVSTGTETATLRPIQAGTAGATATEIVSDLSSRARVYLGKAARDPKKATQKVVEILKLAVHRSIPERKIVHEPPRPLGAIKWRRDEASEFAVQGGGLTLVTDTSDASYQASSQEFEVPSGHSVAVALKGVIETGAIAIGALNADRSEWLGNYRLSSGDFDELLHFDPAGSPKVTIVINNAGTKIGNRMTIELAEVSTIPPDATGLPVSEMTAVGWNVGYSVAGEVVAVGEGVTDLSAGDLVACAGAGQANHADYVAVKRNLVCRIPKDCPVDLAATTTVGSIALQGVRRAAPQLGDVVAVMGLGLLGMITVQLLRASGARVLGIDLDPTRAERAIACGALATTTDPNEFQRLVRDFTNGNGVDQTIITAASKSHAPINSAMEVTRRKGRVVIVGDIGLKVERAAFYQKEIDLLMSTSYGPGRYDADYEAYGRDYPYAYVRWTLNRNMQSYLDAIAERRIDIRPLIDRIASIDQAAELYKELVETKASPPLAVIFAYPDDRRPLPDRPDSPVVHLRGHRKVRADRINYALVGAGAFGVSMLVPQMERRSDRFFLRAVVSRDAVRGGNFARGKQIEMLASEIESILPSPDIDLVVVATRHNEHARQAIAALRAGKHVFVEKPLALNWNELDAIKQCYDELTEKPLLMVGFNRRFSPAVQALAKELIGRYTPLVINYRMNAGYLPQNHWTQGPDGGGRNIGEACHIYDVFRLLAGSPVAEISATAIDPQGSAFLRNDNFVASIRYHDGSIGNLVYCAMGPKVGMPKEQIEVLVNGEGYVIDDYKSLRRCSDGKILWQGSQDKGHFEELSQFGDAIAASKAAPIPFDQLIETSAIALHVEGLISSRSYD
jgi:predicted dehydrogenase/threonine dehydrogenase-like Zn-dependent dehydrogenase